ncbi:hypothetical protein E2C01_067926 [Portunus trituberculatus]|uniref:Uncharacterized protein n=1 Tax=Portunus trituberculatus TaxID=210409 RepID=A0A5B7HQM5_PORTR|nr:hypothetical protein [Portunus trituberculatus]
MSTFKVNIYDSIPAYDKRHRAGGTVTSVFIAGSLASHSLTGYFHTVIGHTPHRSDDYYYRRKCYLRTSLP